MELIYGYVGRGGGEGRNEGRNEYASAPRARWPVRTLFLSE